MNTRLSPVAEAEWTSHGLLPYLDEKPDFPKSVMARWQREKRQQFGANWDRVQSIMATLRRYGIYLADVKPGNISFD